LNTNKWFFECRLSVCMYLKSKFLNLYSGGWNSRSTRHCGHQCPIVPAPSDYDDGEIGGMIGRGNRSTRRKPAPIPLCPQQTPHACPDANPGRRGGKPATNRLSIGHPWNALFHFSFLILRQSVGLLGWGISPSQFRYLYKHRINTGKHPCLDWDSNPRYRVRAGEDSSCLRPHSHCD
jgi:hypothetical protein